MTPLHVTERNCEQHLVTTFGISLLAAQRLIEATITVMTTNDPDLWDDACGKLTDEGVVTLNATLTAAIANPATLLNPAVLLCAVGDTSIMASNYETARNQMIVLAMGTNIPRPDIAAAAQLTPGRLHQIKKKTGGLKSSARASQALMEAGPWQDDDAQGGDSLEVTVPAGGVQDGTSRLREMLKIDEPEILGK